MLNQYRFIHAAMAHKPRPPRIKTVFRELMFTAQQSLPNWSFPLRFLWGPRWGSVNEIILGGTIFMLQGSCEIWGRFLENRNRCIQHSLDTIDS